MTNMNNYDFLVGKTLDEVRSFAAGSGLTTRIVNMENIPFMLTCEYRQDRLNLTIKNGIVTEIGVG